VRYLQALQAYQDVFFAEEENHIRNVLQAATLQAQTRAEQIPVDELIEELSHGVRLEDDFDWQELMLVPSYWISPLVVFEKLGPGKELFLFGARPADVSLVPGDMVPDGMLRTIKTLGDPTRLRILRYLSREGITPAELVRRLRLRAPTVTHHLNQLRLAGLVYLTLGEKGKRRYEARPEAVDEAFELLRAFLMEDEESYDVCK
jgi:DNA-binding transcriptional ArsR family regulator